MPAVKKTLSPSASSSSSSSSSPRFESSSELLRDPIIRKHCEWANEYRTGHRVVTEWHRRNRQPRPSRSTRTTATSKTFKSDRMPPPPQPPARCPPIRIVAAAESSVQDDVASYGPSEFGDMFSRDDPDEVAEGDDAVSMTSGDGSSCRRPPASLMRELLSMRGDEEGDDDDDDDDDDNEDDHDDADDVSTTVGSSLCDRRSGPSVVVAARPIPHGSSSSWSSSSVQAGGGTSMFAGPSVVSLSRPNFDLRDVTVAHIYLESPGGERVETIKVLVIRDELGIETYWYPAWPFFRYVGYSHKRHIDQLLDPTMTRTYAELRTIYGLSFNRELDTRYMDQDGMSLLTFQRSSSDALNVMRLKLREILRHFHRTRMFVVVDLLKNIAVQFLTNVMPPGTLVPVAPSPPFAAATPAAASSETVEEGEVNSVTTSL